MKKVFFFFLAVAFIQVHSQTVCLNMIVKNESKVIERCLTSVKNFINYWVIVDTGSTDGTQEIIKNFMKDIPGELHQSDWINFEYNRNEALQFARGKGDYVLFIDADEQLLFPKGYQWPVFDKDSYLVPCNLLGTRYLRVQLINNKLDWKWVGVLHEYLDCPKAQTRDVLKEITNIPTPDGCRSQDPQTFFKDAILLETELEKDPNNSRNVFYLAQTYFAGRQFEKALKAYERRVGMPGNTEEDFFSLYRIGVLQEYLKMPPEIFLQTYIKAFLHSPHRFEPLHKMAVYYRRVNDFKKGYDLTKLALKLPVLETAMFIEDWVYSFDLLLECSIDAYYVGNYEESKKLCLQLLEKKDIPQEIRDCTKKNLEWANSMIDKTRTSALTDLLNSYFDQLVKQEQVKIENVKN